VKCYYLYVVNAIERLCIIGVLWSKIDALVVLRIGLKTPYVLSHPRILCSSGKRLQIHPRLIGFPGVSASLPTQVNNSHRVSTTFPNDTLPLSSHTTNIAEESLLNYSYPILTPSPHQLSISLSILSNVA